MDTKWYQNPLLSLAVHVLLPVVENGGGRQPLGLVLPLPGVMDKGIGGQGVDGLGGSVPIRIPQRKLLDAVAEGENAITGGVATCDTNVPGQARAIAIRSTWLMFEVHQGLPGRGQRLVAPNGPEAIAMEDGLGVEGGEKAHKGLGGGRQPIFFGRDLGGP